MGSYYGDQSRSPRVQEQLLRDRLLRGQHEPDVEEANDINDETLATQLNRLEEISESTGSPFDEDLLSELIQSETVAHAAWSNRLKEGNG